MKTIIKKLILQLLPLILEAIEELINDLLKRDPVKNSFQIDDDLNPKN